MGLITENDQNEENLPRGEVLKPKELFHATSNAEIVEFVPRAERVRDPDEGPVIFATPDKVYSAMFIVPSDDTWTSKGRYDSGPWTCVIGDIERYKAEDRGGAIYTFDSKPFETDPKKNLHNVEWVSKASVVPRKKELFSSGLEAMILLGVRVVVFTPEQFEVLRSLKEQKKYKEAYEMIDKFRSETLESVKKL